MSALTPSSRSSPFAQAGVMLGAMIARLGRELVAAWRRRNDLAVLASFDDLMLKDIGLSRGDVNDALAEPLWRDPTAVLVRRQRGRRRARCTAAVMLLPARAAPSLVPDAEGPMHRRRNPPVWLKS